MQVAVFDRQAKLTSDTREFTQRRLLFALSRFNAKIDGVKVVLDDVNGPRGGIDKSCQVTVKLRHLPDVRVSSEAQVTEASIARAADRAGRAVARAVELQHRFDRRPALAMKIIV